MRMVRVRSLLLLGLAATTLVPSLCLPSQAQDRIVKDLQDSENEAVRGSVHPLARPEFDEGGMAGSALLSRMVLTFSLAASQQAELDALLNEQQNPLSAYYHQWLTPEQYADRFGLSGADVERVVRWLQARGFTINEVARSRTYVAFSGTVAQVESAFATAVHRFTVNGEPHFANVSDPRLPAPLAQLVLSVRGLNDFRPQPRARVRPIAARPRFSTDSIVFTGNHYLAPDDFAAIYDLEPLYSRGIDGTGQRLAIVGQTDLVLDDIATFRSLTGLPANPPVIILVPGSPDPGVLTGDIDEAELDVQWSGAVARNATIVYVNSKNAFDSLSYAISQNLAPVISISYGGCEADFSASAINTLVALGQQANAQGQTIVAASGDSGAADCDFPATATAQVTSASKGLAVDMPASLPTVTGAGGTEFNESPATFPWMTVNTATNRSAIAYMVEMAWNDTVREVANGGSLSASGGGASKQFAKPVWQTGPGVPADGQRDVPDISLSSSFEHDGYLICVQGSCATGFHATGGSPGVVVGGTSVAAPTFAGIVALLNQQMGVAQGNVNPRLYQLAASSTDALHDITTGDNMVPCTAGTTDCPNGGTIGFTAGVGYDTVTGLGSPEVYNLVSEWATTGTSPPSFIINVVAQGTTLTSFDVSVAAVNGFAGTVTLSLLGLPSLATATFSPAAVVLNGPAAQTATLQITAGLGCCRDSAADVVGISGTGGNVTRTVGVNAVFIPPDFQIGSPQGPITLSAGPTGNVATTPVLIQAFNGFNALVNLSCTVSSTLRGTTCSLSPTSVTGAGTATLTITAPTTRAGVREPRLHPRFFPWPDGMFAMAAGLLVVGKRERSSKTRLAISTVLLLVVLTIMFGCGGGVAGVAPVSNLISNAAAQTGTVTVQATSAPVTHTAVFQVTVR